MRKRFPIALGTALLIALVWGTSAQAAVMVPIPGLSGAGLVIPAAQRTDSGGGVILATGPGYGAPITLARVDADGTPDLAYGSAGLAKLDVPPDFHALRLAINPATGSAWVGGWIGNRAEVVAVGPAGLPQRHFGTRGTVVLPVGSRLVRHISWRAGGLLVSDSAGCGGCGLDVLSPDSGHVLASRRFVASDFAASCHGLLGLTGAIWDGSDILVAVNSSMNCKAETYRFAGLSAAHKPVTLSNPVITNNIEFAAAGGQICEGSEDVSGARLWGLGQPRATTLSLSSQPRLDAIVPLGAGACAALLKVPGQRTTVFQIPRGGAAAARTAVPRGFDAQNMFRCDAHLLVLGTVGKQAEILAVPLSEGSHVAHMSIRRAASLARTTGCT